MPSAVKLSEKLTGFTEQWAPKIVAQFNGHDVMLVKVEGEFVWHAHAETDDFFLVLKGRLLLQLREGEVELRAGDPVCCAGGGGAQAGGDGGDAPAIDRDKGHAQHGR